MFYIKAIITVGLINKFGGSLYSLVNVIATMFALIAMVGMLAIAAIFYNIPVLTIAFVALVGSGIVLSIYENHLS